MFLCPGNLHDKFTVSPITANNFVGIYTRFEFMHLLYFFNVMSQLVTSKVSGIVFPAGSPQILIKNSLQWRLGLTKRILTQLCFRQWLRTSNSGFKTLKINIRLEVRNQLQINSTLISTKRWQSDYMFWAPYDARVLQLFNSILNVLMMLEKSNYPICNFLQIW